MSSFPVKLHTPTHLLLSLLLFSFMFVMTPRPLFADTSFDPWWYAAGGLLHGYTELGSQLPDSANSLAQNALLKGEPSTSLGPLTAGTPLLSTATSIDTGYRGGFYSSFEDSFATDPHGEAVALRGGTDGAVIAQGYQYFANRLDLSVDVQTLPAGYIGDASFPAHFGPTVGDDDTRIFYIDGDVEIAPSTTWITPTNERYVFLVNGDLTFSGFGELISTDPGSYLAFIAAGDITFSENTGLPFGTAPGSAAVLEAVCVADQTITVAAYGPTSIADSLFIAEGTFVGWGLDSSAGISLPRDYDDDALGRSNNQTNPMEVFVFRPDFTATTPLFMRAPLRLWQEVN